MTTEIREAVAEFTGTLILVFFAVGSAVFGIDKIGPLGVAFAFGLVLLALAYSIGPTSGCHVNPAVTLGVLLRKGMTVRKAGIYWAAQFAGGIVGAALLKLMASSFGKVTDQTGGLGSNNWGKTISGPGAFLLEVILTFLLVFVVLLVTGHAAAPGFAGLAIGLVLTVIHLVGIPLDGTSVNPARSLGPALFHGGSPLTHVWVFIVAPLIGGALSAVAVPFLELPASPTRGTTAAAVQATDPTGADVPADRSIDRPTGQTAAPAGAELLPPGQQQLWPASTAPTAVATTRPAPQSQAVAGTSLPGRVVRVLSFFTIQSNILSGIVSAQLARNPHRNVPILMVIGWVLFGPRPRIELRTVALSLLYPIAWIIYTVIDGGISSWYPYPFLDVITHGYGRVAGSGALVVVVLSVVTALFWWGDPRLPPFAD